MLLWVIFAAITAAALAILLWPLVRPAVHPAPARTSFDLAVYEDQLAEVDRDLASGRIGAVEAEAARNEIRRRMLAAGTAAESASASGGANRKAALALGLVAIPVLALAFYAWEGRPDLPGVPWAERMAGAVERGDFPAMVAQVEQHLAANPNDAEGWRVIAPSYRRLGRYQDAAHAYATLMRLESPTAAIYTDYGEALMLANEGVIPVTARKAFDAALELDPTFIRARIYRGLALQQEGRSAEALALFRKLLDEAPANAPWRVVLERQIAQIEATMTAAPKISEEQMKEGAALPEGEQQAMIRGMVDGLSQRLEAGGGTVDEWLRLARARVVLGEKEQAKAAIEKAKAAFSQDSDALRRIAEAEKTLGLGPASP